MKSRKKRTDRRILAEDSQLLKRHASSLHISSLQISIGESWLEDSIAECTYSLCTRFIIVIDGFLLLAGSSTTSGLGCVRASSNLSLTSRFLRGLFDELARREVRVIGPVYGDKHCLERCAVRVPSDLTDLEEQPHHSCFLWGVRLGNEHVNREASAMMKTYVGHTHVPSSSTLPLVSSSR